MGQEPVNWGSARSKKRYLSGRQSRPAPRSFWGPFQPSSCWASPLGGSAGAGARTGVKAGGRGPACSKLSLEEPVWALVLQLCHQRIFLGLAAAGFSVTQARFWRTAGDLAAGGGREEGKEEECKKERKKTAVREGSEFSPFRTNDESSISHPVPIWGLDFHLSSCCFCALLFPSERKHLSYTKRKET